jgi:hypothetical protein
MRAVFTRIICNGPVAKESQFKEEIKHGCSVGASKPQASTSSSQEFQGTECNVPNTAPLFRSSIVTSVGSTLSKARKYLYFVWVLYLAE